MKKAAIIFMAVCFALSCGSGGNNTAGVWEATADSIEGGQSTINMSTSRIDGKEAHSFNGFIPSEGVGVAWPWVQAEFIPDEATAEALKNAQSISFMVRGNGGEYTIRYHVNNVEDWAWHGYTFAAPADATKIEIPLNAFMQPAWGRAVRLQPERFTQLSIAPVGYNVNFDFTIWDLQINQ